MEFPMYPNEADERRQLDADFDLVLSELKEWAAYWGNHNPETDEAVQALARIRVKIL